MLIFKKYHCSSNNQSQEKRYFKNVVQSSSSSSCSWKKSQSFTKIASRIADEMNKKEPLSAFLAGQFLNLSNQNAHYLSSGPEIFNQLNGNVDGFICAIGTGGTLLDFKIFKRKNSNFVTGLVDPPGEPFITFIKMEY